MKYRIFVQSSKQQQQQQQQKQHKASSRTFPSVNRRFSRAFRSLFPIRSISRLFFDWRLFFFTIGTAQCSRCTTETSNYRYEMKRKQHSSNDIARAYAYSAYSSLIQIHANLPACINACSPSGRIVRSLYHPGCNALIRVLKSFLIRHITSMYRQ